MNLSFFGRIAPFVVEREAGNNNSAAVGVHPVRLGHDIIHRIKQDFGEISESHCDEQEDGRLLHVAPFILIDTDQLFRGSYFHHHQGDLPDYVVRKPRRQSSSIQNFVKQS